MNYNVWKLPQPVKVLGDSWQLINKNKKLLIGLAGVASIAAVIYLRNRKDDTPRFERTLAEMNVVEEQAVQQMSRLQYVDSKNAAATVLHDSTLPVWQNFRDQIGQTKKMKLDHELEQKRQLLLEYADLRVEQAKLLYSAFSEDTNKYDEKLMLVYERINGILDQLDQ